MLCVVFCAFLAVSCTHTTVIKALDSKGSVDPAVSVYVDGQFLGKGEVVYSDQKTSLSAIPIYELKKETCPNVRETLRKKTDWINALGGSFIAGAGLGIMSGLGRIGKPGAGLLYGTPNHCSRHCPDSLEPGLCAFA